MSYVNRTQTRRYAAPILFSAGVTLLLFAAITSAPSASADDITCTEVIASGSFDNVLVQSGDCELAGSVVVDGNVVQSGGNLTIDGISVGGNVQAEGGASTVVLSATMEGNVQIKQTTGLAEVQDSAIGGDIQVEEKNDGSIRVVSNDVEGNVQIWKNSGGDEITIRDNTIDGNLQCEENAPNPSVDGNDVSGDIECVGDADGAQQDSSIASAELDATTQTVVVAGENIDVDIRTNSIITNFELDEQSKRVSFVVGGSTGTVVVTEISIGTILEGPYAVTIDGQPATDFDVTNATASGEVVAITLESDDTNNVVITGTNVVPELPYHVILVVSVVIGSIIAIRRIGLLTRFYPAGN